MEEHTTFVFAEAIASSLRERDLKKARALFDKATGGDRELVQALVRQLATTVVIPTDMVVWGHGKDVWANPYRWDYAWRCGGCRWTASNYKTERAARASAKRHAVEDHACSPLVVVSYLDDAYWHAVEAAGEGAL